MIDVATGFAIQSDVFTASEMADLLAALDAAALPRTKAGARNAMAVPAVRELANDRRLLEIATRFVGGGAVALRATLFDKSPASNWLVAWHQDTALPVRRRIDDPAWGPWSVKAGVLHAKAPAWALEKVIALRVHLDDSTASNGPLRVVPDTHRLGLLDAAGIERCVRDNSAVDCLTPAGGVIAMRPLLVHASSKSETDRPRRVLHVEYVSEPDLGAGVPLAVG